MSSLNIEITQKGNVKVRQGFKTLRGLITWLKKTNKRYLKKGIGDLDYTIRLPLKP